MNTKESLPHALGRKALDAMIRRLAAENAMVPLPAPPP